MLERESFMSKTSEMLKFIFGWLRDHMGQGMYHITNVEKR